MYFFLVIRDVNIINLNSNECWSIGPSLLRRVLPGLGFYIGVRGQKGRGIVTKMPWTKQGCACIAAFLAAMTSLCSAELDLGPRGDR